MAIELPLGSRFRFTEFIKHNGAETFGRWSGFKWKDTPPQKTIVVGSRHAGRLDLIAAEELGSPNLWWAILYFNDQTDLNWPRAGDEVRIPNRNEVLSSDVR